MMHPDALSSCPGNLEFSPHVRFSDNRLFWRCQHCKAIGVLAADGKPMPMPDTVDFSELAAMAAEADMDLAATALSARNPKATIGPIWADS